MRAAAGEAVHLQLNQSSRALAVISRKFAPVEHAQATATYRDLRTGALAGQPIRCTPVTIAANAVTDLGCEATWPVGHEGVLLLRLLLTVDGVAFSSNEYWLAPTGAIPEETAWAQFRTWKAASQPVQLSVTAHVVVFGAASGTSASSANLTLHAPAGGPAALGIRLQLGHGGSGNGEADTRVLPAWFSANYFSLLPGEQRSVLVECDSGTDLGSLELRVTGYNIAALSVPVRMHADEKG